MPFDAKTSFHQAVAKTNGVRGLSFPVQLPEFDHRRRCVGASSSCPKPTEPIDFERSN